jgi:hypothetical protein
MASKPTIDYVSILEPCEFFASNCSECFCLLELFQGSREELPRAKVRWFMKPIGHILEDLVPKLIFIE